MGVSMVGNRVITGGGGGGIYGALSLCANAIRLSAMDFAPNKIKHPMITVIPRRNSSLPVSIP